MLSFLVHYVFISDMPAIFRMFIQKHTLSHAFQFVPTALVVAGKQWGGIYAKKEPGRWCQD